ncbi:ADP-ribosylglycohydrolase family protein [Flavobacterium subsaxonicum]|uniref:ADP-ribosylglycohydrolase family protein n=1 Tax=Flavobacterium subsaxonicum TaxID=426226 RepID=UPI00041D824D|nr:ADP-ribosylglycohydrolase family protein [Flavobacterium subsaxonicum]
MEQKIKAALFGVAVGDALGVPVEFMDKEELQRDPVIDMRAFGTHNQPAGTFSDDASLTFCLAEALTYDFDIDTVANNFVRWAYHGYWSAHGNVFDIGIATQQAIEKLARGVEPELAGGTGVASNGNGSLMRILPLVFYIKDMPIEERFRTTKQVSAVTHGHIRSVIACFYYLEFARYIIKGLRRLDIYDKLKTEIGLYLKLLDIENDEIALFDRLLIGDIYNLQEEQIQSSGYVLHTLEAAIWCMFNSVNYKEAVLKAVNLGSDTDTTAAVTGGLAGLYYGFNNIPQQWLHLLAKHNDIGSLAERMSERYDIMKYDFIATLKFDTAPQAAIMHPVTTGNWQNITFDFEKSFFGARRYFMGKEEIYPGETVRAHLHLALSDYFKNRLDIGMAFTFYDGSGLKGSGIIEKITNPKLKIPENP